MRMMVSWFLPIVLKCSGRWGRGNDKNKNKREKVRRSFFCIVIRLSPLFLQCLGVSLLFTFFSSSSSSSPSTLSVSSVHGLRRTDAIKEKDPIELNIPFKIKRRERLLLPRDYSSPSPLSTGTRTKEIRGIRRKGITSEEEKEYSIPGGHLDLDQRRDKRRSTPTQGFRRNEGKGDDKESRHFGRRRAESDVVTTWDWESVVILDEHELKDEVDTGKTRVNFIPEERHLSIFLNRGMNGRFLFPNFGRVSRAPLTLVVTPCNSILSGSVNFLEPLTISSRNSSKMYVELKRAVVLERFRTQRTMSYMEGNAQRGIYMLEIRPIYSDTYVHLFVTTSSQFTDLSLLGDIVRGNGTQGRSHTYNFLNMNQVHSKPWVGVQRLRGNRIHVKWDTSPINPQNMHYCIVVNSRRDYVSLCSAQGDKFGFLPPDLNYLPMYQFYPHQETLSEGTLKNGTVHQENVLPSGVPMLENDVMRKSRGPLDEILVGCLKKKTNYILTDLHEGHLYYFNVFIKDTMTGLSYPYIRITLKYQSPRKRPNHLRDAKATKVGLGSKSVTLKFHINKPCTELSLYVMPCGGGAISYRIFTTNRTIIEGINVDSLDLIKMAFPLRDTYFINVGQAEEAEGQGLARMAEIYMSKKQKKFPLPKLPATTTISEVVSERSCDAVTVQWVASPDVRDNEYCIFLKVETRKREFHFKKPNQCDVERSLESDPYVSHSFCVQKRPLENDKSLLTQRVSGLQPNQVYILQLIVRRHKGKSLSYDLTDITTTQTCLEK